MEPTNQQPQCEKVSMIKTPQRIGDTTTAKKRKKCDDDGGKKSLYITKNG